ncbi:galactose oxidase [Gigaspora margarita]|uniref:Galactose oxidase n=1 Tax=Gigaspora margarita TaxID=4874 RepID=A0A8H4B076_GIGMA|nr:galactose oxidase [Gigaspora margarita]
MKLFRFVPFTFLISSYLLFLVTCLNVPSLRIGQTSVLVGTKLYFFGGYLMTTKNTPIAINEVWYLDLSNSSLFNTVIPTWYKDVEMPVGIFDISCVSSFNNSDIFVFGGRQYLPNSWTISFNSSVYRFDPNNNSIWSIPNITSFNSTFKTRSSIQAVIDKTRVFIFGGTSNKANSSDNSSRIYYNDMNILDITNMSWSTLVIPQSPPYFAYTATLLPTGLIVYISGLDYLSGVSPVNMSEIRTFNTTSLIWSNITVNGSSIESRWGHSAVLGQNGDIIIYGGSKYSVDQNTQALPNLAVLNTNSWTWSIPDIPPINTPKPLSHHSAALYKNYMIVAFGFIASTRGLFNKDVYVLDTQKYVWIAVNNTATTTKGSSTSQKSQTNKAQETSNSSSNKVPFIGIGVVSGIVLIGIISFVIFLLFKKRHKSYN